MKALISIVISVTTLFLTCVEHLDARTSHQSTAKKQHKSASPHTLEIPKNLRAVRKIWELEFKNHDWSELATRALGHYSKDHFAALELFQNAYQLLFCRLFDLCALPEKDAASRAKNYVEMLQEKMNPVVAYEVATEGVRFPSLAPKPPARSPIGRHRPAPGASLLRRRASMPKPYAAIDERGDIVQYRQDARFMLSDIAKKYGAVAAIAQALQQTVPQARGMFNLSETIVAEAAYQVCGSLDTSIQYQSFDALKNASIDLLKKIWNDLIKNKTDCAAVFESLGDMSLGNMRRSEAFDDAERRGRLHALRAVLKRISDHLTPAQRALIPRY